ncbi:hypothetical protein EVAR_27361_1 [Eumeta japonica]|uniref:Uncharacterized protein n=1 Tax=Eumeta variegata TaxID=151549 RepID=A0A4C1UDV6_EUMVA|nr:hypothetical protein EVAR_27361_1 [Eumeta japonica]
MNPEIAVYGVRMQLHAEFNLLYPSTAFRLQSTVVHSIRVGLSELKLYTFIDTQCSEVSFRRPNNFLKYLLWELVSVDGTLCQNILAKFLFAIACEVCHASLDPGCEGEAEVTQAAGAGGAGDGETRPGTNSRLIIIHGCDSRENILRC